MTPNLLAIYMTPDGPIEIGAESPAADLARAMIYARRHASSPNWMDQSLGFNMMAAIAQARMEAEALASPVFFKSRRAA